MRYSVFVLSELRVRGYKSYKDETVIPLGRITVLLGKNNSGKTAAARLPLVLLNAAARRHGRGEPIPLAARGVSLGSQTQELVSGQAPHLSFELGISGKRTSEIYGINVEIQLRQVLLGRSSSFISKFESVENVPVVTWIRESSGTLQYSPATVTRFDGLFPEFDDAEHSAHIQRTRRMLEEEASDLLHLGSIRAPLTAVYENREAREIGDIGGAEAPYLLNQDSRLLAEVSSWYEHNLGGVSVLVESEAAAFRLLLADSLGSHNLSQAGQGFQQVLPVVCYLAAMRLAAIQQQILIIEEPELHLHPAAHGAIAERIVDTVTENQDSQVIIETHSENLILRLRRLVASGKISATDIALLWFDHKPGGTLVRRIPVLTDGSVSDWPSGVFSEDLDEVRAITQERR